MKTKEFIKKIEQLGYLVAEGYADWQISRINKGQDLLVAIVNKNNLSRISTDFVGWWDISDEDKSKLLDIIVEYAKTPIKDRKDKEKRYYLKHRWLTEGGFYRYVKHHTKAYGKKYELASWTYGDTSDMQYTFKEIEEIKKKFDTDLKDFELVEVEDDN